MIRPTYMAFLYDHGTYTTIDPPTGLDTYAIDINSKGDIVGHFQERSGGPEQGFLYSGGKYTIIDFPGALNTHPQGINDKGQIVGFYQDNTGQHSFVEDHGVYTTLDLNTASSINNNGEVVGFVGGVTDHGMLATPGHGWHLI